jgi:hypothetical protein
VCGITASRDRKPGYTIVAYCSPFPVKTLRTILLLALAAIPISAQKKHKPPDLEVLEVTAHRGEEKVSVDGRVRNSGEKPIKELTLLFNFLAPGNEAIDTEKGEIDEQLLEPGKVASFHMEANAPPRAVQFEIVAQDGSGRELRVGNAGPFTIE